MYARYDIMCEIQNFIDSLIADFEEKDTIICKYLKPYQIKILSFYYSDFTDDELYKMRKVLDMGNVPSNDQDKNKGTDSSRSCVKTNNLYRLKLYECIEHHISNYISNDLLYCKALILKEYHWILFLLVHVVSKKYHNFFSYFHFLSSIKRIFKAWVRQSLIFSSMAN